MSLFAPILAAFITPGFAVAGLALAAVPIIIHILNRRRFKVVQWAAMEYLLAAMKRNRRRLKFEQWLLLATRCLVLALMGLALSRPLGCGGNALAGLGQRVGLHVIIIDTSYSMAYEAGRPNARTHLDQAKLIAGGLVERLGGQESVVLITAGAPARAVLERPSYDLAGVQGAIERIEQEYGATDIAGALRIAQRIAAENESLPKRMIYLITDGTRSAWDTPQAEQVKTLALDLSRQFKFRHYNLGRPNQWNHAVVGLSTEGNLVTTRFDALFLADARAYGTAPETLVQWKLDDQVLSGGATVRLSTDNPPQTRSAQFTRGGPHVVSASLLSDDRLRIDNSQLRVVDVASELKTLIVEGDRGVGLLDGSAAFLDLALAPPAPPERAAAGMRTTSYVSPELISEIELGNKVLTEYSAVILTNVPTIQPTIADQLQKYVESGGTLLMFMGPRVSTDSYNETLVPRKLLPGPLVRQVNTANDQEAFGFDFNPSDVRHPYLNVFRNEPNTGLDTAQVFTYIQMALPENAPVERVLDFRTGAGGDNTTDKDPAITVHTLGQGRIVFVATTADPEWTLFPAKPAYVVLMHELLSGSVRTGDAWMNLTVGEPLVLPRTVRLTASPVLIDAQQREIPLRAVTDEAGQIEYRSEPIRRPGQYWVRTGERTIPIAVNLPAEEADIRTLEEGAIRAALGDIEIDAQQDALVVAEDAEEAGRDFGWILTAAVLVLAASECAMAMYFGHNRR